MIIPIIASIGTASEIVLERFTLAKKHLNYKVFVKYSFIIVAILMLFLMPFLLKIDNRIFEGHYMMLLLFVIIISILYNVLYFWALKNTEVEKIMPMALSNWIFAVILALIFLPKERVMSNVILALIASITLFAINIKKHHLVLNKYSYGILFFAFLLAIHDILITKLLEVYAPFTLYFIRCAIVSLVLLVIHYGGETKMNLTQLRYLILISVVVIIEQLFRLWSFKTYGIIVTSIFMSFAPIMAMWGSNIFLKEKLHKKYFYGMAVITGCIIVSIVI